MRRAKVLLTLCVVGVVLTTVAISPIGHWAKLKLLGKRTVGEVVASLDEKMAGVLPDLDTLVDGRPIALVGLKAERRLEVWKQWPDGAWRLVKSYTFTGTSGGPGPKLRRGDRQIPEGFYRITSLNPNSQFHLSMELDYPNDFDRRMAEIDGRDDPGDHIFIHGSHASIGCIPIGDAAIEEVFYLVARNGPSNTEVILAPCDLRTEVPPTAGPPWAAELYTRLAESLTRFIPSR